MKGLFISNERKISNILGTGIQYIPGHIEPFVDLVINNYLPGEKSHILDLGGGGLRFAFPAALLNRKVTVVDLDPSGIDLEVISRKINEVGRFGFYDKNILKENIHVEICNCFDYLEKSRNSFLLITAFRLIHFFTEEEVIHFFQLVSQKLKKKGRLIVSAFSMFNSDDNSLNEIYLNSEPVRNNNLYRKFFKNESALAIKNGQNLGDYFHVFTYDYLKEIGERVNLKLEMGNLASTRVVRGYVFIRE
jgi:2-polyprenyl-3-methyl-5-hydroxy-6-metoxy-1,4-benzoquinol methylase